MLAINNKITCLKLAVSKSNQLDTSSCATGIRVRDGTTKHLLKCTQCSSGFGKFKTVKLGENFYQDTNLCSIPDIVFWYEFIAKIN